MPEVRPTGSVEGRESQLTVLVSGAIVLFFGVPAVLAVVSLGLVAAVITGAGLVTLAWFLPTTRDSRIVRVLVALLGAAALLGAVLDVLG